jgi:fumarate reductase subunit D
MNNLLSGYMYAIGLVSAIIIPLVLLIDGFIKPVMGVGPNSKRKKKVFEDEKKSAESESLR